MSEHISPELRKKVLVLHVAIPDVYADDLEESATLWAEGEPTPRDRLDVVLQEWMREEVGITIVTIPGDKSMNTDFMVCGYTGRIVGAETHDA